MKWSIYRQELFVFSPRHKRLRLFHDAGDGDENRATDKSLYAPYRRQIRSVLRVLGKEVIRCTAHAHLIDATFDSYKDSYAQPKPPLLPLSLNVPKALKSDNAKRMLALYVGYGNAVLESERWGNRDDVARLLGDIEQHWSDEHSQIEASRECLKTLPAILPILPHWDTFGLLNGLTPTADSSWQSIHQQNLPVYAAQLCFSRDHRQGFERSKELLDYTVSLEAIGANSTSRRYARPVKIPPVDFYSSCFEPDPKKDPEQRLQYQIYALLFDRIQQALAAPKSGTALRSPPGEAIPPVFYIAYPITTAAGRKHFWHIYLRPSQPNSSLQSLWDAWREVHRGLKWQNLHDALATEIEQMDLAYAQAEIMKRAEREATKVDELGGAPEPAEAIVCECGYNLFPSEKFWFGGREWRYKDYWWLEDKYKQQVVGWRLNCGAIWIGETATGVVPEADGIEVKVVPGADGIEVKYKEEAPRPNGAIDDLRNGRLVDDQIRLAKVILDASQHRKTENESRERADRDDLSGKIQAAALKDHVLRESLEGAIKNHDWANMEIFNPEWTLQSGKPIRTLSDISLTLYGTRAASENIRQRLRILIAGGVHLLLSRMLETDPVKCWSHKVKASIGVRWLQRRNVIESLSGQLADIEAACKAIGCCCKDTTCTCSKHKDMCDRVRDIERTIEKFVTKKIDEEDACRELANLRDKGSGKARAHVTQAVQTWVEMNAKPDALDDRFHLSMPLEEAWPTELLRGVHREVAPGPATFRVFGAPVSQATSVEWGQRGTPALWRSFLVICHSIDVEARSIEGGATPTTLRNLANHVLSRGGRVVVGERHIKEMRYRPLRPEDDSVKPLIECPLRQQSPGITPDDFVAKICKGIDTARDAIEGAGTQTFWLSYDTWYVRD